MPLEKGVVYKEPYETMNRQVKIMSVKLIDRNYNTGFSIFSIDSD